MIERREIPSFARGWVRRALRVRVAARERRSRGSGVFSRALRLSFFHLLAVQPELELAARAPHVRARERDPPRVRVGHRERAPALGDELGDARRRGDRGDAARRGDEMRDARLESRREALGGARALVSFLFGRFLRDASRRDARLEIAQSLRALVPLARRRRQHLQARRHAFAGAVAPGVRRRDQRASPPEAQRQAADVRRALALEDGDAPLPEGPARRRAAVRRRRERQLVPAVRARRDVGAPREPGARGGARAGERHDDGIILEEQTLASETRIEFETRRGIRNASVVRVGFPFVFARAPRGVAQRGERRARRRGGIPAPHPGAVRAARARQRRARREHPQRRLHEQLVSERDQDTPGEGRAAERIRVGGVQRFAERGGFPFLRGESRVARRVTRVRRVGVVRRRVGP